MGNRPDIEKLLKLSGHRQFKKGEYICSEGEEGEEMYIVLQGQAAVYISSVAQEDTPVAKIGIGEFFGEMALFEKQVRSATCIAEEDTVCIAIKKDNLCDFIGSCPEITVKLIAGLSERVRRMNEQLYKNKASKRINPDIPFMIPAMHKDCDYRDKSTLEYIRYLKMNCPVCKENITLRSIYLKKDMSHRILPNQRELFESVEPLWYSVRSCPSCGYSNFYVNFLKPPEVDPDILNKVLEEEKKSIKAKEAGDFSNKTEEYYRAIHFNLCLNEDDTLILGKLWLYLGWLYEDAGQEHMKAYCHEKSLEYYITTFTEKQALIANETARFQCIMIIAELYFERREMKKAKEFYHMLSGCVVKRLAQQSIDRIYEIRDFESVRKNS